MDISRTLPTTQFIQGKVENEHVLVYLCIHLDFILFQSELVQWLLSAAPEERPDAIEIKNSDLLEEIKTEVMKTS